MNVDGERLPLWVNKPIWGRGSRDGKRAFCLGSFTSLKLHERPFCLYEIIRFAKVQTNSFGFYLALDLTKIQQNGIPKEQFSIAMAFKKIIS